MAKVKPLIEQVDQSMIDELELRLARLEEQKNKLQQDEMLLHNELAAQKLPKVQRMLSVVRQHLIELEETIMELKAALNRLKQKLSPSNLIRDVIEA